VEGEFNEPFSGRTGGKTFWPFVWHPGLKGGARPQAEGLEQTIKNLMVKGKKY